MNPFLYYKSKRCKDRKKKKEEKENPLFSPGLFTTVCDPACSSFSASGTWDFPYNIQRTTYLATLENSRLAPSYRSSILSAQ
jgi:hypothetical protein